MRRALHRALNRLRVLMRRSDQGALIAVAVALGLSVGFGVKLFQLGIELFHGIFQTTLTNQVLSPVYRMGKSRVSLGRLYVSAIEHPAARSGR